MISFDKIYKKGYNILIKSIRKKDVIMDFRDDISKSFQEAKEYTIKKTLKIAASAKNKLDLQAEKAKLSKVYRNIGKLTFQSRREQIDLEEEIAVNCQLAETLYQKIILLEKQSSELQKNDNQICKSCGAQFDRRALYCPMCGAKQFSDEAEEEKNE